MILFRYMILETMIIFGKQWWFQWWFSATPRIYPNASWRPSTGSSRLKQKNPLEIQWVGRTPWFCKYKAGAWPSDFFPIITKSKVPDLSKHGSKDFQKAPCCVRCVRLRFSTSWRAASVRCRDIVCRVPVALCQPTLPSAQMAMLRPPMESPCPGLVIWDHPGVPVPVCLLLQTCSNILNPMDPNTVWEGT